MRASTAAAHKYSRAADPSLPNAPYRTAVFRVARLEDRPRNAYATLTIPLVVIFDRHLMAEDLQPITATGTWLVLYIADCLTEKGARTRSATVALRQRTDPRNRPSWDS